MHYTLFSIIIESLKNTYPDNFNTTRFLVYIPKTYMLNKDGSAMRRSQKLEKCAKCFLESVDNKLILNNDLLNYTKCILETE